MKYFTIAMALVGIATLGCIACCVGMIILDALTADTPTTINAGEVITDNGSFTIPGDGIMDGYDEEAKPPLTVDPINIWNAVPRTRVVCEVRHSATVQIDRAQRYSPENRYYFHVTSGSCSGWVSENFVLPG